MRIMGIDYGDSRIGIAVSDPFGWTAQGLDTVKRGADGDEGALKKICQLVKQYDIEKIVVGFPRNMNGTIGPRADKTQEFIDMLSEKTGKEIIKWDERLTTVAAGKAMREMGIKASRNKEKVDRIAAVYILQGYLDSIGHNKQPASGPEAF